MASNIPTVTAQRQADFIEELEEKLAELKARESPEQTPFVRMTFDLPRDLHRRFRTTCSAIDRNMTDELRAFVVKFLEENERK
jgi:hypothetical protein